MKKVIVIGCPGGGKSTFARALHKKTGLPLYYLDMMNWNSDKTTVEKSVFRARLAEAISLDEWIIDGNYGSTMEMRLKECDTVFFLDYSTEVCLDGIRSRRGKARPDMPWTEDGDDIEFLDYVRNFASNGRNDILELLGKYSNKNIIVFKDREESERFLAKI